MTPSHVFSNAQALGLAMDRSIGGGKLTLGGFGSNAGLGLFGNISHRFSRSGAVYVDGQLSKQWDGSTQYRATGGLKFEW